MLVMLLPHSLHGLVITIMNAMDGVGSLDRTFFGEGRSHVTLFWLDLVWNWVVFQPKKFWITLYQLMIFLSKPKSSKLGHCDKWCPPWSPESLQACINHYIVIIVTGAMKNIYVEKCAKSQATCPRQLACASVGWKCNVLVFTHILGIQEAKLR